MKIEWRGCLLAALIMSVYSVPVTAELTQSPEASAREAFIIPDGDAKAGRQAFLDLKCVACHSVQDELDFPKPIVEMEGPVLGFEVTDYSVEHLANSIVNPSHQIAWRSAGLGDEGNISRMGDFTDAITLRQFFDLIAYLRSAGDDGRRKGNGYRH